MKRIDESPEATSKFQKKSSYKSKDSSEGLSSAGLNSEDGVGTESKERELPRASKKLASAKKESAVKEPPVKKAKEKEKISYKKIDSLVGENSFFKGDVQVEGFLRIEGAFQGDISETGYVLIGKEGRFKGTISAKRVIIGGVIDGRILAEEEVILLESAVVWAEIRSPQIVVEDGSLFSGRLEIAERV